MDRSEPSLAPEWLLNFGSQPGHGDSASHNHVNSVGLSGFPLKRTSSTSNSLPFSSNAGSAGIREPSRSFSSRHHFAPERLRSSSEDLLKPSPNLGPPARSTFDKNFPALGRQSSWKTLVLDHSSRPSNDKQSAWYKGSEPSSTANGYTPSRASPAPASPRGAAAAAAVKSPLLRSSSLSIASLSSSTHNASPAFATGILPSHQLATPSSVLSTTAATPASTPLTSLASTENVQLELMRSLVPRSSSFPKNPARKTSTPGRPGTGKLEDTPPAAKLPGSLRKPDLPTAKTLMTKPKSKDEGLAVLRGSAKSPSNGSDDGAHAQAASAALRKDKSSHLEKHKWLQGLRNRDQPHQPKPNKSPDDECAGGDGDGDKSPRDDKDTPHTQDTPQPHSSDPTAMAHVAATEAHTGNANNTHSSQENQEGSQVHEQEAEADQDRSSADDSRSCDDGNTHSNSRLSSPRDGALDDPDRDRPSACPHRDSGHLNGVLPHRHHTHHEAQPSHQQVTGTPSPPPTNDQRRSRYSEDEPPPDASEEKFLRSLGWTPEDFAECVEITEEEKSRWLQDVQRKQPSRARLHFQMSGFTFRMSAPASQRGSTNGHLHPTPRPNQHCQSSLLSDSDSDSDSDA